MHRHQCFRAELEKGLHRFLRIHVHFASARRVVGADRQERDLDLVALADFLEAREISAVAAMKNRAAIDLDDKPAKAAMLDPQENARPNGDKA